jgi:hypothetical protein
MGVVVNYWDIHLVKASYWCHLQDLGHISPITLHRARRNEVKGRDVGCLTQRPRTLRLRILVVVTALYKHVFAQPDGYLLWKVVWYDMTIISMRRPIFFEMILQER